MSAWWAGLTVDHLYENCPNRTRAEASLRECGWWDVHNVGINPEGTDVCGLCLHRYRRADADRAHADVRAGQSTGRSVSVRPKDEETG